MERKCFHSTLGIGTRTNPDPRLNPAMLIQLYPAHRWPDRMNTTPSAGATIANPIRSHVLHPHRGTDRMDAASSSATTTLNPTRSHVLHPHRGTDRIDAASSTVIVGQPDRWDTVTSVNPPTLRTNKILSQHGTPSFTGPCPGAACSSSFVIYYVLYLVPSIKWTRYH